MGKKLLLESQTCGRCGGSGYFGPLCVYAGLCFRCHGKGEVLTKRGATAQAYLNDLKTKPAKDFVVGDLFFYEGFNAGSFSEPSRFYKVAKIDAQGDTLVLVGDSGDGRTMNYHAAPDQKIRRGLTAAEKVEYQKLALAYQATLTKAGKVAKRKMKEAA